jgi:hypothetical protein
MPKSSTPASAIVVFSGKSLEHLIKDGGCQSWVLDRNNARRREYLVCCRSGVDWVEGPEPQGSAFVVGRISDVVPSPEYPGRWLIKLSTFAQVSIPGVWKGWRNPVRYTDLETLGIDPNELTFEPMPEPVNVGQPINVEGPVKSPDENPAHGPLTISEAKRGLALTFGVPEDAIEITIRG